MSATLYPRTDTIEGFTPNHYSTATAVIGAPVHTVGTGLSDITKGGTFTDVVDHVYSIKITTAGGTDAFEVSVDGGAYGGSTNMTGSAQTIGNGVTVTFAATTGHTLNDIWTITVTAGVSLSAFYLEEITVNSIGSGGHYRIYNGNSSSGTLIVDVSTPALGSIRYGYKLSGGIYFILYASSSYPDMIVGTE